MKCERYGIRCPGYLDILDVVMRPCTIASVEALKAPLIKTAQLGGHYASQTNRAIPSGLPCPTLQQPTIDPEEFALGAYYSSYCVSSSTLCSLDHIRQQGNGCLWTTIKLLGMMQIHRACQMPSNQESLMRQYNNATSLLNKALACPSESLTDSTLLATFLLSVVEMKASSDFTLRYWLIHTKGAAALLELRGPDQVLHRLGSALFLQISSQIITYSLLGHRSTPRELGLLRERIRDHVIKEEHPLWQWHGLMYRFVDFYARASAMDTDEAMQDVQAIIAEALSIIRDMECIFKSAGEYWRHDMQPSKEFSPLLDHMHVYYSLLSSRVWNDRRTATILLWDAIAKLTRRFCEHSVAGNELQCSMDTSLTSINAAALEILAAVPQQLAGLTSKITTKTSHDSDSGLGLCNSNSEYDERIFQRCRPNETVLPYMDSCRIQWPVYFAVQCEFIKPEIRSCLLQVLKSAGEIMQMQQWQVLARGFQVELQTQPV